MHRYAERQHLAAAGVARAHVAAVRCAMPNALSASALWSNPAQPVFTGTKQIDPKTVSPRRDVVSTP